MQIARPVWRGHGMEVLTFPVSGEAEHGGDGDILLAIKEPNA
jgi:hypothetical protein